MLDSRRAAPAASRTQVVGSFRELVSTPLDGGVNALCWTRTLPGDFGEVVRLLDVRSGLLALDEARLEALPASAAGRTAIAVLLEDLRRLRELGLDPSLDCIRDYPRDDAGRIVPTDVHSFHVDRATGPADTYLCTYHGPASEGLRNDEARARVDVPETRAALLAQFGGRDDAAFRQHLAESSMDLHYVPLPGAQPYSFGLGNLWRVAVDYPGSPVPPCIHRAPPPRPGDPPRLLLIS